MRFSVLALLALPALAVAQPAPQTETQPDAQPEAPRQQSRIGAPTATPEELLGQMSQPASEEELQRLIAAAASYPLGSLDNPVRVGGPQGERAYLARLRCADGAALRVGARGDAGVGAFGSVASAYVVSCGGTTRRIAFDMYHEEHVENRAPPGFTIAN